MERNYTIYMHKNKINNKVYIGQTYTPLKVRFGKNGIGYRGCPIFRNAIKKYGWENFDHIVLESGVMDQESANKREKYYISLYDSTNPNKGYNIQIGGNEQTKLSIEVHQYDMDGSYIKTYKSISDAQRDNKITNGKISDCCNGKRKSAGGYRWSYEKYEYLEKYVRETNSKMVHQYSLSGNYVKTYNHLSDAVKEFKLQNGAHISSCCNGFRDTAYGYMWSYEKHDKINNENHIHKQGVGVIQYNLDMNIINVFDNCVEAAKQFGEKKDKAYMSINNCLNKKSKSAYGYYWEYCA